MATASRLADKLNAREGSGVEDLRIVFDLFRHYREEYGGFPTGEDNAAIVNALTGNNPQRMAFIPREHPAINAQGEMVDRWQKPLFFHIIGSDAVEIRSAGPDGEMYSPDDLLQRSPGLEQPMPGAPEP